jgi:hypothetical protein
MEAVAACSENQTSQTKREMLLYLTRKQEVNIVTTAINNMHVSLNEIPWADGDVCSALLLFKKQIYLPRIRGWVGNR